MGEVAKRPYRRFTKEDYENAYEVWVAAGHLLNPQSYKVVTKEMGIDVRLWYRWLDRFEWRERIMDEWADRKAKMKEYVTMKSLEEGIRLLDSNPDDKQYKNIMDGLGKALDSPGVVFNQVNINNGNKETVKLLDIIRARHNKDKKNEDEEEEEWIDV